MIAVTKITLPIVVHLILAAIPHSVLMLLYVLCTNVACFSGT